jgi:hypothetical protein
MGDIRRIVIHIGIILGSSTSHAVLSPALLNTDIPAERMRLRITLRLLVSTHPARQPRIELIVPFSSATVKYR